MTLSTQDGSFAQWCLAQQHPTTAQNITDEAFSFDIWRHFAALLLTCIGALIGGILATDWQLHNLALNLHKHHTSHPQFTVNRQLTVNTSLPPPPPLMRLHTATRSILLMAASSSDS